jgi:hypothetical protein
VSRGGGSLGALASLQNVLTMALGIMLEDIA